jgi:hypothetical protein
MGQAFHILFSVDDSILFFKLDGNQARQVRDMLVIFEKCTG